VEEAEVKGRGSAREADTSGRRGGRFQQATNGGENLLQIGIVGSDAALEGIELPSELGMCPGKIPKADESAYDENAHLDGKRIVQNCGGHDRTVLGKRPAPALRVLPPLSDHSS
jgi:hypothetical protein